MSAPVQPIVHTPGPWKYDEGGAIVLAEDDSLSVCDIAEVRGWGKLDRNFGSKDAVAIMDANGRLIAAAPDLLAVLLEVIEDGLKTNMDSWKQKANAAIAKATGEVV